MPGGLRGRTTERLTGSSDPDEAGSQFDRKVRRPTARLLATVIGRPMTPEQFVCSVVKANLSLADVAALWISLRLIL